jgi:hypothetical protein
VVFSQKLRNYYKYFKFSLALEYIPECKSGRVLMVGDSPYAG